MENMEEMPITMGEGHQLHGDSTAATITPIRGGTSALAALAARAHVELANLQREELSRPAVLIPAPSSNTRNGKETRVIEEVPVTAIKIDYSNRANFCNKRKKFSVIVNHPDDSRDSDDVGSDKVSNNSGSSGSMVDCSNNEYRNYHQSQQQQPSYPHISNLNGRMSPQRYSPSSSYATLTPLQPLPPISTVSDKFAYGHSSNVTGSFTVMQHNIAMGIGVHSPYSYDKMMSPPHPYSSNIVMHQQNSPESPQSTYSQNGLSSPPRSSSPNSCYDSPYNQDIVRDQVTSSQSPNISPRSNSLSSPPPPSHIVGPGYSNTNQTMPSIMPAINGLISAAHVIASTSGRCSPLSPPLVHSRQPSLIQSLAMGSPPIDQPPPISPPPEPPQPPSLPQHLQPLTPTNLSHHQQIQQAILAQQIENEVVVVSSPSPPKHIQHQQQHHQLQNQQPQRPPQQSQPQQQPQQNQQHTQVQTCIQTTQQIRPQAQQQISQPAPQQTTPTTQHQPTQQMSVLRVTNNVSTPINSTVNNNTDMEEINTKELAQRISAELKRYSIPQAIFAQRVLCRSQGTLSDLLRNPKPWSKLKSGRETFRRMWKWLQEPEFQRMSALRLAGNFHFFLSQSHTQIFPISKANTIQIFPMSGPLSSIILNSKINPIRGKCLRHFSTF